MADFPDYSNFKEKLLPNDLNQILIDLRTICGNTMELNVMDINISGVKSSVVTIESMVSTASMANLVFRPVMSFEASSDNPSQEFFDYCTKQSLMATERNVVCKYGDVFLLLFSGFALIFVDTINKAVAYGVQGFESRSISYPTSEHTILGSQEAFVETVRTNISMVRRRLKDPALRFEMMQVGEKTMTDVCMVYMVDRTPPEMVDRIRKKLKKIKLESVLASGYIKPFLEEKGSQNLFSGVGHTERPDALCTKLIEGKIGIIVDGTPFVLIIPSLFVENFWTIDDRCSKAYFATNMRWVRYLAFFFAMIFPGMYVATTNYHPEMLSLKLLLNLSVSEQATPYPLFVELIIIMALFELMREASIRLPLAVGSAVSIVGGLVIGDAAVKSGIISSPLLIVVGLTATASFVLPSMNQQTSVLRLMFIFAGGAAGFLGIAMCLIMVMSNVCAMDEFKIPYTSPLVPFESKNIIDVLSRKTYQRMEKDQFVVEDYKEDK